MTKSTKPGLRLNLDTGADPLFRMLTAHYRGRLPRIRSTLEAPSRRAFLIRVEAAAQTANVWIGSVRWHARDAASSVEDYLAANQPSDLLATERARLLSLLDQRFKILENFSDRLSEPFHLLRKRLLREAHLVNVGPEVLSDGLALLQYAESSVRDKLQTTADASRWEQERRPRYRRALNILCGGNEGTTAGVELGYMLDDVERGVREAHKAAWSDADYQDASPEQRAQIDAWYASHVQRDPGVQFASRLLAATHHFRSTLKDRYGDSFGGETLDGMVALLMACQCGARRACKVCAERNPARKVTGIATELVWRAAKRAFDCGRMNDAGYYRFPFNASQIQAQKPRDKLLRRFDDADKKRTG